MMGIRAFREGDIVGTVLEGSPASLEWTHERHTRRQQWPAPVGRYILDRTAGDHTVQWAIIARVTDTGPLRFFLAELSEHSDHILRMRRIEYTEHPYDSWAVGGTADVIWLLGRWVPGGTDTRSDIRGLSPDDWSAMIPVSPPIADPVVPFALNGISGGMERLYYSTTGGAFGFGPPPRMGIIDPRTWEVVVSRDMPGARGTGDGQWFNTIQGFVGDGTHCWSACRTRRNPSYGDEDTVRFSKLRHDTLEETFYRTERGSTRGGYSYWGNLVVS